MYFLFYSVLQDRMKTLVTFCALFSLLFSAQADVVERFEVCALIIRNIKSARVHVCVVQMVHLTVCVILFQDVPECMKYFYKEKVPGLGASTPGAARLCQRFVNR